MYRIRPPSPEDEVEDEEESKVGDLVVNPDIEMAAIIQPTTSGNTGNDMDSSHNNSYKLSSSNSKTSPGKEKGYLEMIRGPPESTTILV
jgi:hypothetical protein